MRKLYNIVKVMLIFALLFTQNTLQAQKCCVECQADVKVISDKQVLLEKIDLKAGTLTTNINTNLYVSYRSGNTQKFWTNLVIATAGIAVSTQLNKATLTEGKSANRVSPLLPLGVSVATLPSIWKNRPRGIPQAGLWIQHRDTRGKLLETWEQPISSEAKNDAELLTVSIDKPLSAGTLEVYLQNGSKNGVYYWGYGTTSKSVKPIFQNPVVSSSMAGCPDGYLPNGQGMCCNPFTGECMIEGGGTPPPPNPTPNPTPPPTGGGCPDGYLPNGNGMCCNPFTGHCVGVSSVPVVNMIPNPDYDPVTVDGGGLPGVTVTAPPYTGPTPPPGPYAGGGVANGGSPAGSSSSGGGAGTGSTGSSTEDPTKETLPQKRTRIKACQDEAKTYQAIAYNNCNSSALTDLVLYGWGGLITAGAAGASVGSVVGATGGTFFIPGLGTVAVGTAGAIIGGISGASIGATIGLYTAVSKYFQCTDNADLQYKLSLTKCQ